MIRFIFCKVWRDQSKSDTLFPMNWNIAIELSQIQLVLLLVLCFCLAIMIVVLVNRLGARYKLAKIRKNGRKGEALAKKYLEKMGYHIIDEQVCRSCSMLIDSEARRFQLRADFLVSKNNQLGIVEVKSGPEVSRPWHLDTRRQLLEYYHYYQADFLLLYNSSSNSLHQIIFPVSN